MDSLVEKLKVRQPVEFESRTKSLDDIKKRLLETKFVFVTFPKTNGQTEIGISVDTDAINVKDADFNQGNGTISITGTCELNYQKIRCVADIDLASKKGMGHIELENK